MVALWFVEHLAARWRLTAIAKRGLGLRFTNKEEIETVV